MENTIQIFKNEEFGQIRVTGTSEEPLFCLVDVCSILGLQQGDVRRRLGDGVVSTQPITDSLGRQQFANFVTEDGLYDTILDSRKQVARQFRKWVTSEVLPLIRKHGAYMTEQALEKALTSPDFLIQLATTIKEEQQKRLEAEQKVVELTKETKYQEEVIDGLVNEISLADMRQRITQIVRKGGVDSVKNGYRLLYSEFDKKYHINVMARINNCQYTGNRIDYIEKELNMLPELYELTCKLFESEYDTLMKEWGKSVRRAQGNRTKKEQATCNL